MANIKKCDRCNKIVEGTNQIGVTIEMISLRVKKGYIRPSGTLLMEIEKEGFDYLPIEFKEDTFGQIDICSDCFKDFMNLKN